MKSHRTPFNDGKVSEEEEDRETSLDATGSKEEMMYFMLLCPSSPLYVFLLVSFIFIISLLVCPVSPLFAFSSLLSQIDLFLEMLDLVGSKHLAVDLSETASRFFDHEIR